MEFLTVHLTRAEAMIVRHALIRWSGELPPFNPLGVDDYLSRASNFARQACADIVNRTFAAEDALAPEQPVEEERNRDGLPF